MASIIGKHYISYITFPLNPLNVTLDCDYVFQTMILTRLVCKFHISLFRFIKHSHSIRFIAVPCKNIVKTYDQNTIHSTNWIISSMSFGHIAIDMKHFARQNICSWLKPWQKYLGKMQLFYLCFCVGSFSLVA